MAPGSRGIVGFRRRLYDIGEELRQKKRDELIKTTPVDISNAANRLLDAFDKSVSVIMAGRDSVDAAAAKSEEIGRNITDLPI